jgi:DNA-binding CsgD family transcriptional regulator
MVGADLLDFIDRIQDFPTMEESWLAFLAFAKRYGFTHGGLADMPGPGERIEDTTMCLAWPEGWRERYFGQNYIAYDPANLHLYCAEEPYTWAEMLSFPHYTKRQRRIVDEASEFKMTSGLIVPVGFVRLGPAMVTIAGSKPELSQRERAGLQLAAIYTHARVRQLSGRKRTVAFETPLSPREKECLQWYAAGKTDWEISAILHISEKSANTYFERIKGKYRVATRAQALIHGLRSGAIHF